MAKTQLSKPVIKMTAAGDQLPGEERIAYLHWISKGATVGDDLLVVDGDGDTIWEDVAIEANSSKVHIINNRINKLKIETMTGDRGTLYVIKAPAYPSKYW